MTENITGHLIVTGEYDDRAVVAVVVGTEQEAWRVADEMTLTAVRAARDLSGAPRLADIDHRVESAVPVRTFAVED